MRETSHERLRDLLGAHAMGALEESEAREVGDHVSVCFPCREELRRLREAVGLLISSAEDPPAVVWQRIWTRIRRRPRLPRRRSFSELVDHDERDEGPEG